MMVGRSKSLCTTSVMSHLLGSHRSHYPLCDRVGVLRLYSSLSSRLLRVRLLVVAACDVVHVVPSVLV